MVLLLFTDGKDLDMSSKEIAIEAKLTLENAPFEMIGELIDLELNRLVETGLTYANWYWETSKQYREEDNVYARFGTRVRVINGAFQAVWFTNTYYKNKNGVGQTKSSQIKKGKGFKYLKSSFKNAHDWEYDLIMRVEEVYAKLRERYSYLSKLKQAYKVYMNNREK